MTSSDFKVNGDLVASWKEIKDSEIFKLVLEVLASEDPLTQKEEGNPMVHYGKILGYAECKKKLEDLAVHTPTQPIPKRTYARKSD